jgi:hypothetical protein
LWGKELAEWAFAKKPDKLDGILSGQQHLLQITLPANKQLGNEVNKIAVQPSGQRNEASIATLISHATQSDNTVQGESYFFRVDANGFAIGMKVTAWISEASQGQAGVIVPESALVWYMDQVYVYIKVNEESFARRMIKDFSAIPEGYFVKNGITAGEEIVVTGGQMLLSEELRGLIPDED